MRQLVQEKENCEFKPVRLCLKIDLVSYPAQADGLVNMHISRSEKKAIFCKERKRKEKRKIERKKER